MGAATSDSDVVNITINAANDPVTSAAPATASVNEDTPTAIALSIADVDAALAPARHLRRNPVGDHGTLTLSTLAGLTLVQATAPPTRR